MARYPIPSKQYCFQTKKKLKKTANKNDALMKIYFFYSAESALGTAIDHLAVCRTLSRDQNWQFKPNMILIKLKRPIAFYGITSDGTTIITEAVIFSYRI